MPSPQQRQSLFLAIYYYLKEREIPGGCISGVWASRRLFENEEESVGLESQAVRPSRSQLGRSPTCSGGWIPACWGPVGFSFEYNLDEQACYRAENRRRKPVLCPNTTENVSIHWVTIPFQSSAAAVLPKSPCSETWCSWVFWLHIRSLLVHFHT